MAGKLLLINPRHRRTAHHKRRRHNPIKTVAKAPVRRRNPAPMVRRAIRRRNPIHTGQIMDLIKPAVIGGVGSVVVDVIMGQVRPMLPASLTTNPNAYAATKAAATIALGMLGKKALGNKATQAAIGALTVQTANFVSGLIASSGTGLTMGAFTKPGMGAFNKPGVAAFTRPGMSAFNRPLHGLNRSPNMQSMQIPGATHISLAGNAPRTRAREGIAYR